MTYATFRESSASNRLWIACEEEEREEEREGVGEEEREEEREGVGVGERIDSRNTQKRKRKKIAAVSRTRFTVAPGSSCEPHHGRPDQTSRQGSPKQGPVVGSQGDHGKKAETRTDRGKTRTKGRARAKGRPEPREEPRGRPGGFQGSEGNRKMKERKSEEKKGNGLRNVGVFTFFELKPLS
ncbi:hypothetical protein BDB00DRAFT_391118 [Zychaea mexicana]|uniref:uncharacterized protein n=1 Tax=Zychaea mexicana TaxID=64656 RepID=UPI0022FE2A03|nr:uncharacterized protein BDB00DRAFT_391118 [Zychaea mexicana]KAI9498565.1 hypothetical protein BDB00DRAFT_391118 [Zychaea mexicana]